MSSMNADKAELERRGHTVYIFSSGYPRTEAEQQKLAESCIFPVKSCRVIGRGLMPIARRPKIVERELEKEHPEIRNFDAYYIHYEAGCSIAGLKLAKKYGIKSVQVMHGREDVGEDRLVPWGFRTIVAVLLNWFHSWYIPHPVRVRRDNYLADTIAKAKMWTLMVNHANFADVVVTPSEHFRQKLIHYGVTRPIRVLHHGLGGELLDDMPSVKSLEPNGVLKMIWHSRVSGEKRILPFLKAIDIMQRDYGINKYQLAVFGDGPELRAAQRYAKRRGLRVKFYGNTKFEKIWQALNKAHLDILVSYNYDTFGMTLLEAVAAGVPSFIVDPDMEEILPPSSYILAENPSPEAMAAALADLAKRPEQIGGMSRAAIRNRDSKSIAKKIDELEKIAA